MSQATGVHDILITTKLKAEWDQDDINKLGQVLNQLSDDFNPLNLSDQQENELREKISQVKGMFADTQDANGNVFYQFTDSIQQLGTGVIPHLISQIQTFGRALYDVVKTTNKAQTSSRAEDRLATGYRKMLSASSNADQLSKLEFEKPGISSLYNDVVRLVSKRYNTLAQTEKSSLFRETWADKLSETEWLRNEIASLAKAKNIGIDRNDITKLIRSSVYALGPKAKIREKDSIFAPLYESAPVTGNPNDIFGNRQIKALYERGGKQDTGIQNIPNETQTAYSSGLYKSLRSLQKRGNIVAEQLAIESGLAEYVNGKNGIELNWTKNPTQDQLRLILARATEIGRRTRGGQAIYERDADLNYNINKTLADVLEITDQYALRANDSRNGDKFTERYITPAGIELISKIPKVFNKGTITSKAQSSVGRIPMYAMPYTTLEEDDQGNLSFVPRSREDMHKVVTRTGQLKVNKEDKGIMFQNNQLTRMLGLNPKDSGSYGLGYDAEGKAIFYDDAGKTPLVVAMPMDDVFERDESGFLKDQKILTEAGKRYEKSVENAPTYNGRKMRFIYSNGQSAIYADDELVQKRIDAAIDKGLANPLWGYDPTSPDFYLPKSYGKTNKHLTGNKRLGTQGSELSDLFPGYDFSGLKFGTISLKAQKELNEFFGTKVYGDKLVDGAGFIDPTYAPYSFQARGLGEGLKGVLGNYDWRDYLRKTVKQEYTPNDDFLKLSSSDQNKILKIVNDETSGSSKIKRFRKKYFNPVTNPFAEFDQDGVLTKFLMPSVAYSQLPENYRQAIAAKIQMSMPNFSSFDSKKQKQITDLADSVKELNGKTVNDLLGDYFENVMDSGLGGLLESEMLKGETQMTVADYNNYENFLIKQKGLTAKQAHEELRKKRAAGLIDTINGVKVVRLNKDETNANINASLADSGLFVVKTQDDFSTNKRIIGKQLAEASGFSDEDRAKSAELYARKLAEMEDVDYWINKDQFMARPDIRRRFLEAENKEAFVKTDKQALEYIQSQITGTRKESFTHYMLPNETYSKLAFPLMGSFFENAISNAGAKVTSDATLGWTYLQNLENKKFLRQKLGMSPLDISNILIKEGPNKGKVDIQRFLFDSGNKEKYVLGGRQPSAIDTFTSLFNLGALGTSLSSIRGGSNELAMLLPEAIDRMNTGDFDGDTIWMYSGFSKAWEKNFERFNKFSQLNPKDAAEIEEILEEQKKELASKRPATTKGVRQTDRDYMQAKGQGEMGKASAIMRNALDLYDLTTPEGQRKFARAYRLGSRYYDFSTSEGQKEGWVGDYSEAIVRGSYMAGRQFSRFQKLVADNYGVDPEDRDKNQPSIFKHRLRSLNNMQDIASAVAQAKVRMETGDDFGFGDFVDKWIDDEYGVGSKKDNAVLHRIASEYATILKGQNDLSHISTRDELMSFFSRGTADLEVAIGKETDVDKKKMLQDELNALSHQRKLLFETSEQEGGYGSSAFFKENIEQFAEKFEKDKDFSALYGDAAKMMSMFLASDVDAVIDKTGQSELIDKNIKKFRTEREARKSYREKTAAGFLNFWRDQFKDRNPTTTQLEKYITNPTALPVRKVRYDENGELTYLNDGKTQEIAPKFDNPTYQQESVENDMKKIMGMPEASLLDTPFGTFLHQSLQEVVLEGEKDRLKNGKQHATYTPGDLMKRVRDKWVNGETTIDNKNTVSWKDILTGKVKEQYIKDPLTEEEWNAVAAYLSSGDPNAKLELDEGHGRIQDKIKGAFSNESNNGVDRFFKFLFGHGKLFESETMRVNKNTGEIEGAFGPNDRVMVRDLLSNRKEDQSHYGPDLIWQMGDDDLNSDLWMYDWKPTGSAGEQSIYQMINYAMQAEENSKIAYEKLQKIDEERKKNGQTSLIDLRKKGLLTDKDLDADFTAEQQQWLKYRDAKGKFRIKKLVGKDYTGVNPDSIFDFEQEHNLAELVLREDLTNARDLWFAARGFDGKGDSFFAALSHMIDTGYIDEKDSVPEAIQKYVGSGITFKEIADARDTFSKNHRNTKKGGFSGSKYIKSNPEEWNFLVARYSQDREKLADITERLRNTQSRYRTRAQTDTEYSQFDSLFEDLSALDNPEVIGALEAVYKDVLPAAMQDIGKFVGNRDEQQKILRTILDRAVMEDPIKTAEAFKRQLYGTKENDLYSKVQSIVGKANLAAGSRQTYKKPFEKGFFAIHGEEADKIWAQAAEIQEEWLKYSDEDTSDEAKEARNKRTDFVENILKKRYSFDKGKKKDRMSSDMFMQDAFKYAEAQDGIDALRATERDLINRLYEDDKKEIENEVDLLTHRKETPGDRIEKRIGEARTNIDNSIASKKIDIVNADKEAEKYIKSLSRNFSDKDREALTRSVQSGNVASLAGFESIANPEDLGILEQVKLIIERKNTLQDAITKLNDYLNNGMSELSQEIFKDAELELGMRTKTPEEIVGDWRKERLDLRDAKDKHAQQLLNDGKYEEYFKFVKEHPSSERASINQTADAMLGRITRERENQITDYVNELSGDRLNRAGRVNRRYNAARDRIQSEFDKLGDNDPLKARYRQLLDNDALWGDYRARLSEEERTQDTLRRLEFDRRSISIESSLTGRKLTRDQNYESIYNRLRKERIARQQEIRDEIGGQAGIDAAILFGQQHNNASLRQRAAEIADYEDTQDRLRFKTGIARNTAAITGINLTEDEQLQQIISQRRMTRNDVAEGIRSRYGNRAAQAYLDRYDNDFITRMATQQFNNQIALSREQENLRIAQSDFSFDENQRRITSDNKTLEGKLESLWDKESIRIQKDIADRNAEKESIRQKINPLQNKIDRGGTLTLRQQQRYDELTHRDRQLDNQIAELTDQQNHITRTISDEASTITEQENVRRMQQSGQADQTIRQINADRLRLTGEDQTVEGKNYLLRDQELTKIQNQRTSIQKQIAEANQEIRGYRARRASNGLSADEELRLRNLSDMVSRLGTEDLYLRDREQDVDNWLGRTYNANRYDDIIRQTQNQLQAEHAVIQHQNLTNAFAFDQNRIDYMARQSANQMRYNLASANASDTALINNNMKRIEALARKDVTRSDGLYRNRNGNLVVADRANQAEFDRLMRQNNEANARIAENNANIQNIDDYENRVREMKQREEDLKYTRYNDAYANTMMQGKQIRRRRYGTQTGVAGRILDTRDSLISQARGYRQGIEQNIVAQQNEREKFLDENGNLKAGLTQDEINKANQLQNNINGLNTELTRARQEEERMAGSGGTLAASLNVVSNSIGRVVSRFGRRLFQNALQETKKFVKEFDASMNEIQAITLKSDEEMTSIRSQTISKAIGLKTSVSNVAQTEAALYRQGLSDTEVSQRTDSIIKFATVTKLNISEATKIITTALQNDLVGNVNEAMDALVALGDNAATTAAEIGKGMQKAAASAKVAGVSYGQLTSLLTIGTADTQLSGTQVGTSLQTVFTRMRRLSLDKYVADQNGDKTTASDAEAALKSVGIDLWENKSLGKMRSSYDVLSDLSKTWSTLNDAQKSIVTNALAGTRQTNVFSTLMEGMSEDNGATLDKYLDLAENSNGVTQSKYEIAMQSINASTEELRSSFDSVVETFTSNGLITGALDTVSGVLQSVSNTGQTTGGKIGLGISGLFGLGTTGILSILGNAIGLGPLTNILAPLLGGLAFAGGTAITDWITGIFNPETEEERTARLSAEDTDRISRAREERDSYISKRTSQIEKVEKLGEAFDKLKNSQDALAKADAQAALTNGLRELTGLFPDLTDEITNSVNNLDTWTEAVQKAKEEVDTLKGEDKKQSAKETIKHWTDYSQSEYNAYLENYREKTNKLSNKTKEKIAKDLKFQYGTATPSNVNPEVLFNLLFGHQASEEYIKAASTLGYGVNFTEGASFASAKNADERIHNVSAEFKKGVIEALYKQLNNEEDVVLSADELRGAGFDFIKDEMLPTIDFSEFASDKYDASILKQSFLRSLVWAASNNPKYNFFDKEGNLQIEEVSRFFDEEFAQPASKNADWVNTFVKANGSREDATYHIGEGTHPDFLTNDYNAALEYISSKEAKEKGYTYTDIKLSNGAVAYQDVGRTVDSLIETANADKKAHNLEEALKVIADSSSFDELSKAYDSKGLGAEFGNVLSSNSELFGAYLMARNGQMNYEQFQQIAAEVGTGRTKRSDLVQSVYDAIQSGWLSVEDFRTEGVYSGVYKTFSSIVGDSADAVLNAIEDGVSNPDATKEFNKSLFSQRIKEALPLSSYLNDALNTATAVIFGTAIEQINAQASQRSKLQEYDNYVAAIERYASGNVKSGDYALIAKYDQSFTEAELQNNYDNSAFRERVKGNVDVYSQDFNDKRMDEFTALLAGVGLTANQWANLDERISDASLRETFSRLSGIEQGTSEFEYAYKSYYGTHPYTRMTRREAAENISEGSIQKIEDFINDSRYDVIRDNNGIITGFKLKANAEEKLTTEAIDQAYQLKRQESDLNRVYQKLSTGATLPSITLSGVSAIRKALTPEEYELLLNSDSTFATMENAGVSNQELSNYISTIAAGRQISPYGASSFNKAWTDLFGGKEITEETLENARNIYSSTRDTNTREYYDLLLNSLPSDVKSYIQSSEPGTFNLADIVTSINLDRQKSLIKTYEDALKYAIDYRAYNNKGAFAAQEAFDERKNYTSITDFLENAKTKEGFKDLAQNQDYLTLYEKYFNLEDGSLKENVSYDQFLEDFSNLTMFSRGTGYATREDIVERARAAYATEAAKRNDKIGGLEQLRMVLGDDLYSRWRNGEEFTGDLARLVEDRMSNYANGITGFTVGQRSKYINEIANKAKNGGLSDYVNLLGDENIKEILSDFSGAERYIGLLTKKEKEGKLSDKDQKELDTLQTQFETLQNQANIKLDVEGLQALEEAGTLLDGTAAKIEKLQKGGTFAIEAMVDIKTDVHKQSQLDALLASSNEKDVAQAVMQLTGATEAEYYKDENSKKVLFDLATYYREQQRNKEILSYNQYRETLTGEERDKFDAYMLQNGYEFTNEYIVPEGFVVENGKVVNPISNQENTAETAKLKAAGYQYRNATEVDLVAQHTTAEQKYTQAQINAMARRILNGEDISNEERDLYNAAESQYSWLKEYRRGNMTDETARLYAEQEINAGERSAISEEIRNRYAGDRNVNQIVSNYETLQQGTAKEIASIVSGYESQVKGFANAQYLINNGEVNQANTSFIAGLIGESEDFVKKSLRGGNKKELSDKVNSALTDSLVPLLQSLNLGDLTNITDKTNLLNVMDEKGIPSAISSIFDTLIESFEIVNGEIRLRAKEAQEKNIGEAFEDAVGELDEQTRKQRISIWLKNNFDKVSGYAQNHQKLTVDEILAQDGSFADKMRIAYRRAGDIRNLTDYEALAEMFEKDNPDLKAEDYFNEANIAALMEANLHHGLSDDVFKALMTQEITKQAADQKYQNKVAKYVFGDMINDDGTVKIGTDYTQFAKTLVDWIGKGGYQGVIANSIIDNNKGLAEYAFGIQETEENEELSEEEKEKEKQTATEKYNKETAEKASEEESKNKKYVPENLGKIKGLLSTNQQSDFFSALGLAASDIRNTETSIAHRNKSQNKDGTFKEGKKLSKDTKYYLGSLKGLKGQDAIDYANSLTSAGVASEFEITDDVIKAENDAFRTLLSDVEKDYGFAFGDESKWLDKNGQLSAEEMMKSVSASGKKFTDKQLGEIEARLKGVANTYNEAIKKKYLGTELTVKETEEQKEINAQIDKQYSEKAKDESKKLTDSGVDDTYAQMYAQKMINDFYRSAATTQKNKAAETAPKQVTITGGESKTIPRGGGGGGGGTPAWQKALQDAEYRVKVSEHEIKMAQLRQEFYGNRNDYSKQIKQIKAEEKAYKNYEKELKSTIKSLEAERSNVAYGTQEYYKLTEAINQYTEKLQEAKNARDKLFEKRIAIEEEKQEWADVKQEHPRTMQNYYLERAKTLYERGTDVTQESAFANYLGQQRTSIDNLIAQKTQNDEQLKKWQKLLKKSEKETGKNSEQTRNIQKKIWAIQEENAQIENEVLNKELEIAEARLAQIATVLQNNLIEYEHASNMSEIRANVAQMHYDYSGYRNEISKQKVNALKSRTFYEDAITATEAEMANYTVGSPEWINANKQLLGFKEALEKVTLTVEQYDQAMSESYINEITDKYGMIGQNNQVALGLAEEATKRAQIKGNYIDIPKYLEAEKGAIDKTKADDEAQLRELIELRNSGKITDESAMRKLDSDIKNLILKIDQDTTSQAQKLSEIAQARLTAIDEWFNRSTDWVNHSLEMFDLKGEEFKTRGELRNYGLTLNAKRTGKETLLAAATGARDMAKNEYESYTDKTTKDAQDAAESYQKWDKQVQQLVNDIENLDEAIKENNKNIIKAQTAVENATDSWIRSLIQKQKDMNSATVSLQNTLLDAIKESYRKQWELIDKDIDKKKEALEEEKNLISERLNARKSAASQEDKENKLSELQKQLALVESDPTRSKEATALRKQIEELQKEIALEKAENLANAEIERLNDQQKAYDDYKERNKLELDEFLADNNNFKDYLSRYINEGTFDELIEELFNKEEYKGKTEEEKQSLRYSLKDTWLKSRGELETYWDEVISYIPTREQWETMSEEDIAAAKQTWLDLYHETDEYKAKSDADKELADLTQSEVFDDLIATYEEGYLGEYTEESSELELMKDFFYDLLVGPSTLTLDELSTKVEDALLNFGSSLPEAYLPGILTAFSDIGEEKSSLSGMSSSLASIVKSLSAEGSVGGDIHSILKNMNADAADKVKAAKDKEAASIFSQLVAAIGNVDLNSEDKIKQAESQWESMSKEAKGLVSAGDQSILTKARSSYNTLKEEDNKRKEAEAAAAKKAEEERIAAETRKNSIKKMYDKLVKVDDKRKEKKLITSKTYGNNITKYNEALEKGNAKYIAQKYIEHYHDLHPDKTLTIDLKSYQPIANDIISLVADKKYKYVALNAYAEGVATKYLHGGLVDYTGPAWVDGTKRKPEAFLDYVDTKNIQALTESLRYITPYLGVLPTSEMMGYSNSMSVGTVNVTINQAELKEDADYEEVARRVGNAFNRELQKNGFNLASYSF